MIDEPNETSPTKIDAENEQPKSAAPAVEKGTVESAPVPGKKPEMGRFQRTLRTGLIALAVILLVFLAGFLTDHFARYRPTKAALDQAQQSVSDLQNQVDALTAQLNTANDRIAVLEPDLESASQHV